MQRAVHMFKRVGTAWIMSGLRMLRSCITTNNWAQRSSDVFGVCESGMVGGADLSHMFRNLEKLTQLPSNCHSWEVPSLKLHWASKTSHPRTPLKVNASHALIVQYAVKWCGATIISYSTPAFLTRHCKPEYIRICLELDALQQVNIAVITPDSMICAFDLCVCTVKRRQSKPEHTLKIPETSHSFYLCAIWGVSQRSTTTRCWWLLIWGPSLAPMSFFSYMVCKLPPVRSRSDLSRHFMSHWMVDVPKESQRSILDQDREFTYEFTWICSVIPSVHNRVEMSWMRNPCTPVDSL